MQRFIRPALLIVTISILIALTILFLYLNRIDQACRESGFSYSALVDGLNIYCVGPERRTVKLEDTPNRAEYRARLLDQLNRIRLEHGLRLVVLVEALVNVAQGHSADMARRDFCSHTNPDGLRAKDRLENAGIQLRYAETVACGTVTPEQTAQGWLSSPAHKAALLDPNMTHIGVGFDFNPYTYQWYYWTVILTEKK